MMEEDEVPVLEIDHESIAQASKLIARVITNLNINKPYYYENEVIVIRLDQVSSSLFGITDPLGQLGSFLSNAINSALRWLWDQIKGALVDLAASIVERIGAKFPELARNIADGIRTIGSAISDTIVAIGASIQTALTSVSLGITALSVGITNLGTSISGVIASVSTSLAASISSIGFSISQTIVSTSTAISYAISSVGASLSQAILGISTALSVGISSISAAIASSVNMIVTSLSGAISMLGTSIAFAINQIGTSIAAQIVNIAGALSAAIASVATSISQAILSISVSLSQAIVTLSTSISTAIVQVGISVTTVVGAFMTTVAANIMLLAGRVDLAIAIMRDFFPQFRDAMTSTLRDLSEALSGSLKTISQAITDTYTRLSSALSESLVRFTTSVSASMKIMTDTIVENSAKINQTLADNLRIMADAIYYTSTRITDAIEYSFRTVTNTIIDAFKATSAEITRAFSDFTKTLGDNFQQISDKLREAHEKSIDTILDSGRRTIDFIAETSKTITDTILENLNKTMDALGRAIDQLGQHLNRLAVIWQGFSNSILQLPVLFETPLEKHAKFIWLKLFEETSPDFKTVFQELPKFFKPASVSPFLQVINIIGSMAVARPYGQVSIGEAVKLRIEAKELVLGKLNNEIPVFLTNPSLLLEPVYSGFIRFIEPAMKELSERVLGALRTLWDLASQGLEAFAKAIYEGLKTLAANLTSVIFEIGRGLFSSFFDIAAGLGKGFSGVLHQIYEPLGRDTGSFFSKYVEAEWRKITESYGIRSPEFLKIDYVTSSLINMHVMAFAGMLSPLWAQVPLRSAAFFLHKIGQYIYSLDLTKRIDLRPFGIGISFDFNLARPLGASLSHFAAEMKSYADTLAAGLAYGLAIWTSQPITRLMTWYIRNFIPVTLPTMDELLEMTRRAMPRKEFKEIWSVHKFFTALYGYSDFAIDKFYASEEEYSIAIKDRFNTQRLIPLSLMYNLPTPSDVARMVVRDILTNVEDIVTMFSARGMNKDTAMLYYLLHFRYPPPERLWSFYTRGISGLLWATISPQEQSYVAEEAQRVGAFVPTPPVQLNFKGGELENMLKTYMKWHDYARFAYSRGWPSDNLIVIDTLADIPTKIDQRWMVRFGLYQLLSEKGVRLSDPIKSFVDKLVEPQAKSSIMLDLTNFCRTLQATGLHPYYVPITAVAETINTIVDERTLLRTGVLNLYKEGFYDSESVVKMFTGFFMTTYKVAVYDPETHQWREGFINVPLRYLEMEARLMGIRAIMDRALDILRDIQRDVITGYQEFIIEDYEDFKKRFSGVISNVASVFSSDFQKVTGMPIPDDLKIEFHDEYYKPYVGALDIWRDIYTIRRIRVWTQRWLGWLMYRIATGVVKEEELSGLVEFMAKQCRLPDMEKQYISETMRFMWGIAAREYIPTPAQLATLAEYVKLPSELVGAVFEARQVPKDWRPIWQHYIEVRPLADDVKALITAYRRLLVYTHQPQELPAEIHNAVKSYMALIGFTEKEFAIFDLRVRLEEMLQNMKEYIPTPTQLATLAEYAPVPEELVKQALQLRRVPEAWQQIWISMIKARPLADDVRALISTYLRALEYSPEAKAAEGTVLQFAQMVGYGAEEIEILRTRAQLEELIYKARQYVPTPLQLASIAEVLPEARGFYTSMATILRIPAEWHGLWAKYIDIRPLIDDIKKMLSRAEHLYVRFMISEETYLGILNSVASYMGLTERERDFLMYSTRLERHAQAWREIVGDVDRMVMLSEYSPTARQFALGTLYKMIDSLAIDDETKNLLKKMWEDFIRIKPVIEEVRRYVTDLINAFVDGTISQSVLESELEALREWGLDDYEIQFYKAIATLRKARRLRITIG